MLRSEQAAQVKSAFIYLVDGQWHFPSVAEKVAPEDAPLQMQTLLALDPVREESEQEAQVPSPFRYCVAEQDTEARQVLSVCITYRLGHVQAPVELEKVAPEEAPIQVQRPFELTKLVVESVQATQE